MTACVNKKHTRRVALAISASLVGALSLGAAAPAVAFATNDGIQTMDIQDNSAFAKAELVAAEDGKGHDVGSGMPDHFQSFGTAGNNGGYLGAASGQGRGKIICLAVYGSSHDTLELLAAHGRLEHGRNVRVFCHGNCLSFYTDIHGKEFLRVVGTSRLELLTSSVSRKRSSHLSYAPVLKGRSLFIVSQPSRQAFFSQL